MEVKVSYGDPEKTQTDALFIGVFEDQKLSTTENLGIDNSIGGYLTSLFEKQELTGSKGELTLIHTPRHAYPSISSDRIILVGLGDQSNFTYSVMREAAASCSRYLINKGVDHVAAVLPGKSLSSLSPYESAVVLSEGFYLGTYRFDKYKTRGIPRSIPKIFEIIESDRSSIEAIEKGLGRGFINASSECFARDLVNEPANRLSPTDLSDIAKQMVYINDVTCKVFDLDQIEALGMGAFAGVAVGASRKPKFIHLSYSGDKKNKENNVWLIGKAITFDTGGISLKPASGMASMKGDMGGGAAVLSAFKTISESAPRINVNAVCAATDNMPSGSAQKPGDVVNAMNGMSIEVDNTDAEGRLTLADAICYAKTNGATNIIDVATLTGAARIALGTGQSAIFGNDESLISMVIDAGKKMGEVFWQLPLDETSKTQNASSIADIKNTGGRSAGSITAAHFISEFAVGVPWVHLDIAATSMVSSNKGWYKKGATGVPTRTLINLVVDLMASK